MKNILPLISVILISVFFSCSNDDEGTNVPPTNSETRIFAIDTARILSISEAGIENEILNRFIDLNSYIADMDISANGAKIIFIEHQRGGTSMDPIYKKELRIANADGSVATTLYTTPNNYTRIGAIRFCSDDKIFFETISTQPQVRTYHLINADGSGSEEYQGGYNLVDVTNDRLYYLTESIGVADPVVDIISKEGDNGAGSLYHRENFTTDNYVGKSVFTDNGQYAAIPYKDGSTLKIRLIKMADKSMTEIVVATGLTSDWVFLHLDFAADSNRGLFTVSGAGFPKSKTYGIDLASGQIGAPYENNDEIVSHVYIN